MRQYSHQNTLESDNGMTEEFCCEPFEETVLSGGIRKLHGKWISDILMYREDKSTFSPVYNIEGVNILLYVHCPWCGTKQS